MADGNITIRTSKENIDKINRLAKSMDRSRNWVIEDALNQYIETQEWQVRGVEEALEEIEAEEYFLFKDVKAEIQEMIDKKKH